MARITLWGVTALVIAFLFAPILLVVAYAFDVSTVQSWPIEGFTLHWFADTWADEEVRTALLLSAEVAAAATLIATGLGTLAAFGIHRFAFFGREALSFAIVLPIALPGVLTGMALNSYFVFWDFEFSFWTIVIGHATFCIVIVYNNVIARLRRLPNSFVEASADLGAGPFRTFRLIVWPMLASSVGAGALLAFALSFDEVIVTTFTAGAQTTLPLWIFGAIRLGQHLPEVNVVVAAVMALTLVPVIVAQRLMGDAGRLHK